MQEIQVEVMKKFKSFLTEDALKTYVSQIAKLQKPPKGIRTPAMLMKAYGQSYTFDASSFEGKRGTVHQCYANAGRLATDNHSLTYVEGYLLMHGVPLEHAWCVDAKGHVIEPTITERGVGGYFGIPIKRSYLVRTIVKTKVWGVLSPMNNRNILTDDPKDIVQS
jgi:hypothetical protein